MSSSGGGRLLYPLDLRAYFALNPRDTRGAAPPANAADDAAWEDEGWLYETYNRLSPNFPFYFKNNGQFHGGLDIFAYGAIASAVGVVGVRAIAPGVIKWTAQTDTFGKATNFSADDRGDGIIFIEHEYPPGHPLEGEKFLARYVHLRKRDAPSSIRNKRVEQGEEIGKLGALTDTHLHIDLVTPHAIEEVGPGFRFDEICESFRNNGADYRDYRRRSGVGEVNRVDMTRWARPGIAQALPSSRYSSYNAVAFIHWANSGVARAAPRPPAPAATPREEPVPEVRPHEEQQTVEVPQTLRSDRVGASAKLQQYATDARWRRSGAVLRGERGDHVKAVQRGLLLLGFDLGRAGDDGAFGEKTEAALWRFQKSWMPPWESIIGDHPLLNPTPWAHSGKLTWNTLYILDRLVEKYENEPVEQTTSGSPRPLKSSAVGGSSRLQQLAADTAWRRGGTVSRGEKGDHVKGIQRGLLRLGFDLGSFRDDGDYGRRTEDAIRTFQTDWMPAWENVRNDHPALGAPPWPKTGAVDWNTLYILDDLVFADELQDHWQGPRQEDAQPQEDYWQGPRQEDAAPAGEDPAPQRLVGNALQFHTESTTDPRHVIIQGVTDVEGAYNSVNMWDSAVVSVGMGQWTIIHGKMQTLYDVFRAAYPADYRRVIQGIVGIDLPPSRRNRDDRRVIVGGRTIDVIGERNYRQFNETFRPDDEEGKQRGTGPTASAWKQKFSQAGRDPVFVQCQYEFKTFELFRYFFRTSINVRNETMRGYIDPPYRPDLGQRGRLWQFANGDLWLQTLFYNLYVNAPSPLVSVVAAAAQKTARDLGYGAHIDSWPDRSRWRNVFARHVWEAVAACTWRESGSLRPWRDRRRGRALEAYQRLTGDRSSDHDASRVPGVRFDTNGTPTGPANAVRGWELAREKATLSYL